MELAELSREQIIELKEHILCQDKEAEGVSYGELLDADELIPDSRVKEEYSGTIFSEDDFFCTAAL